MALRLRTFTIQDGDAESENSELSFFLASVEVERVDTAYDAGFWRILVLYKDLRRREEAAQIESIVQGELRHWRTETGLKSGTAAEQVLTDEQIGAVARFCPTTPMELRMVLHGSREIQGEHDDAIVATVRRILDSLT